MRWSLSTGEVPWVKIPLDYRASISWRLDAAIEAFSVEAGVLVNDANRAGAGVGGHENLPIHEVRTGLDRSHRIRHGAEDHLEPSIGNPMPGQHRQRVNHGNSFRADRCAVVVG